MRLEVELIRLDIESTKESCFKSSKQVILYRGSDRRQYLCRGAGDIEAARTIGGRGLQGPSNFFAIAGPHT